MLDNSRQFNLDGGVILCEDFPRIYNQWNPD